MADDESGDEYASQHNLIKNTEDNHQNNQSQSQDGYDAINNEDKRNHSKNSESEPFLGPLAVRGDSEQKTSRFVILLSCTVSIGGFLFGYDTGIISGAILKVSKEFDLNHLQQEWIIASCTAGAMVGALIGGVLNDFFGRKPSTLTASFLFAASSIMMAFAQNFTTLLIGRIIAGMGVGLASMTVPLYIAEISPPNHRGKLVSANILFVTGGQFISYLTAAALSVADNGWRYMLGLGVIPPLIQFIGMYFLPESPRYLVKRGKVIEAKHVLGQIGSTNPEEQIDEIQSSLKKIGTWNELFSKYPRQLLTGSMLLALQQLCGINTAMYYSATILKMAGFESDTLAIVFSSCVAFANMVFTVVGMNFVDRMGRRKLLLSTLLGCVCGLALLGVAFFLILGFQKHQDSCPLYPSCSGCVISLDCGFCLNNATRSLITTAEGQCFPANDDGFPDEDYFCVNEEWKHEGGCPGSELGGWIALISLIIYVAFFAVAMGPVPWTVMSEIFPLPVRGKASGIAGASNWTANLIVSSTLLTLFGSLTHAGTFWLYSGFCLCSWIFVLIFLPETKGVPLEEMEKVFATHSFSLSFKK